MISYLKSRLRRLRFTLVAIAATLSTALIITPARAAGQLGHIESGDIAAVFIVGTLAFALAFEIWHIASRRVPVRDETRRDD